MKRIAVFCGSSLGRRPAFRESADALGRALVARGLGLVYGGAQVGLMGVVADAVLAAGGETIGVIPASLRDREIAHQGLHELHVVDTMRERKALIEELSDGFIALPGGSGTREELTEAYTLGILRYHEKPCGLLNVGGYYDGFLSVLDQMVEEGFFRRRYRDILVSEAEPEALLDKFGEYQPPVAKWG